MIRPTENPRKLQAAGVQRQKAHYALPIILQAALKQVSHQQIVQKTVRLKRHLQKMPSRIPSQVVNLAGMRHFTLMA